MSVEKGLTIRPARKDKIKAEKKELRKEPRWPEQRLIADIPTKLHKQIKILGMELYKIEEPENEDEEEKIRAVTIKDLVTEALDDLMKKYKEGNGNYDRIE